VETVAGSGVAGSKDGVGTDAQFTNPVGVGLAPNGDLYVTEYEGKRVRKITPSGQTSTIYEGIWDPFGIIIVGADAIYVSADRNPQAEKTSTSGTLWKVSPNSAEVVVTGLDRPRGIVQLNDGRIALTDREHDKVVIVDPSTKAFSLLAGYDNTPGYVDALGDTARFNISYGCALLPDGSIVLADQGNNVIRRVALDGNVSTFAGDGQPGMKDDADKLKAEYNYPQDVATDALGNVYVSDFNNYRIRRITTDGAVETVAGNGIQGYADGLGTEAEFFGQEQIELSPDGKTLYVSDGNRGLLDQPYHRIRKITLQ
jgi:sugar lactone lactonase YvrE